MGRANRGSDGCGSGSPIVVGDDGCVVGLRRVADRLGKAGIVYERLRFLGFARNDILGGLGDEVWDEGGDGCVVGLRRVLGWLGKAGIML